MKGLLMKRNSCLRKRIIALIVVIAATFSLFACGDDKTSALDPKNPVTATIWNYYNGDQLIAFEHLVEEFNSTVGIEKGIVVVAVSQGDIDTVANSLIDAVAGKAGAQSIPTLASVYAETAYILDESNALASLDKYFTDEELSAYVPGFIEEGRFNKNNDLLLFPIIKSTEIFTANETDWELFDRDTGITLDSITTKEELTAAAKVYYEWTDALTPDIREDGKALYGRDSVANYVYIGCYQLGQNMFEVENGKLTVNLDRDTFKTLWDNFYVPYVNGYFASYAKFRSEDAKTGRILALTSSSSSAGYLPTAVTLEDDSTHNISIYQTKDLPFENTKIDSVVQQGASYCLLKSTDAQEEGAVEFLKWFTAPERNVQFAIDSGYSPVTLEANKEDAIKKAFTGEESSVKDKNVLEALVLSADSFSNSVAYATKPINGSKDVRSILGDSLETLAITDREAVVGAIAGGATREEAVSKYVTDEYFDAWFNDICNKVNMAIEK